MSAISQSHRHLPSFVLTLPIVGLSGLLFPNEARVQGTVTEPVPITRFQPATPTTDDGEPLDGWAVVRYRVLEDGTTSDVRVNDILPPGVDPEATVRAVSQWTFEPATEDGEPVAWYNNESVIVFGSADGDPLPLPAFNELYDAIRAALESGEYTDALAASRVLLDGARTHTELGLALAQQATLRFALMDPESALRLIRLATDIRVRSLPESELLGALQLRFQLEAQLGRNAEALDTYQRIAYALGPDLLNPLESVANRMATELESSDALAVQGRVDNDEPWRIGVASRRTFTFADVDGSITGIDAECNRGVVRIEYQPDTEWSLPPSLGDCELFVATEPGTSFRFIEFRDAQQNL
jgi:hypothetical protein